MFFIDRTLYRGGAEGRTEREARCYTMLDRLGIEYMRADHDPADTIELCRGVEEVLGCEICKNLFLTNRQETEFYLLLMPGDKPFKTKYLSKQIGSARLSFAGEEHMQRLLGLRPGSVSVLGLMNDGEKKVHLLIDRDLLKQSHIGCHPCLNSSTLKIALNDILEIFVPATGREPAFVNLPWGPAD